jgi:hypothetical protein
MPIEPAKTLRDAYNAADPAEPLPSGDPRYVDCTDVRGNRDVVQRLFDTITWSDTKTAQLLTGHRGCGKSTELLRLKARLEDAGYAVITFEADEDLDVNDIIYSDLLLAIGKRVESELREVYDITLPADLLANIEHWFAEMLYTEDDWKQVQRELAAEAKLGVGLPASAPLLARLMARITGQIKTGHDIKKHIRRKIDPQISALIENVNLLLLRAHERLRRRDRQGLVLLIDNLDRVTLRELDSGRTSHDALYIDHGEQLRSIKCHVVYTVPISMVYSPKATQLKAIFPNTWVVPMIKVAQRDDGDYTTGLERLRTMLARRVDLDTLFDDEAVDFLCRVCGGHPRHLMRLVTYACIHAPRDRWPQPIDLAVAQRAEEELIEEYSRQIPEAHYPKLARVHLRHEVENDKDHQTMLYNLSVLEYLNGPPPWHDVHPAVLRLPKFQEALEREREELGLA